MAPDEIAGSLKARFVSIGSLNRACRYLLCGSVSLIRKDEKARHAFGIENDESSFVKVVSRILLDIPAKSDEPCYFA